MVGPVPCGAVSGRALAALLALACWACSSDRGSATGSSLIHVPSAAIDTDAVIDDLEPGGRTGLFIEYASGGHWRMLVTCDVSESQTPCEWDVVATSAYPIGDIELEQLSTGGWTEARSPTDGGVAHPGIQFVLGTTTELQGVRFTTPPGAAVRVDVMLDGVAEGRYTHWVGGGAIHRGAPEAVLDLVPTTP